MKYVLLLAAFLVTAQSYSQNISGKAYYESKTTVDMSNWGNREMSEEMKRQIAERMKNMLEKTYILTFNGNESIYKEEEKLETGAGGGRGGMRMMMSSFSAGKQYKNVETNQILEEREFFGKQFLINDTITNLNWEVSKESKMIGQYLAIKATALKQVDPNDLSMARRRRGPRGDREENKEAVEDTTKVKDPMEEIEVPKEVLVTAWFTPQIPVKNGPGEYAGLPGLILEMNVDRTTILCSKIVLNPKDADAIEAPSTGKEMSRAEYNKVVKEKTDEMRENWRGRGGRRGGGGRRIGG